MYHLPCPILSVILSGAQRSRRTCFSTSGERVQKHKPQSTRSRDEKPKSIVRRQLLRPLYNRKSAVRRPRHLRCIQPKILPSPPITRLPQIGRASCRERV